MGDISIYTEVFINQEQQEELNEFLQNTNLDISDLMQSLLHDFISNLSPDDLNRLDKLVKDIFDVIPSYYDKSEAERIKKLIIDYIKKLEHTGQ